MATYSIDGERFVVANARELVKRLRGESRLSPASSEREWLEEVAGRAQQATGKLVRTDNLEQFIADLIEAGLIEKEEL